MEQIIVFRHWGAIVMQLTLDPRDVCPYLLWREHKPHQGHEPRQLAREFRMLGGRAGEVQQFFCDQIIERSFEPIS